MRLEVQIGGIYVSKGKGVRRGKRVRVRRWINQSEGPPRIEIEDLDGGKTTKPLYPSFRAMYEVESLPQAIVKMVRKNGQSKVDSGEAHGAEPGADKGEVWRAEFELELEALRESFLAGLERLRGRLR